MAAEFVHLHCHTQYSMLDGAIRLSGLVDQVKRLDMKAVAVTDHMNMFGTVQLHKACKAAGVSPIVGCEVNLTSGARADESSRDAHHLLLLARNQTGYLNLIRIVSRGWVEGLIKGVPRVDFELLAEHREGVVCSSACMGGYLAQEILQKGPQAGRAAMAKLRDTFEPGSFFVELQDHGFPEQGPLNEILVELARDLDVPVIATNDCHYLDKGDAHAQLVLQCIGASRTLEEMQRMHHKSEELYLKSAEEMVSRFRHVPGAIDNTLRVAEMCAGQVDPLSAPKLPAFEVPGGLSEEAFLRQLSAEGLVRRIEEERGLGHAIDEAVYRDRLELELGVIVSMGFPGYFLIVQDFINWAKEHGVPVGPGRGSGAGSIVAWALRITDLDPIPYGLLFERFLNPERVSMPDFDVDFCMGKRDQVIEYVRGKYGRESVGQIATFHLLKSRSVVRDVGRVMGFTPADAGRVATLIPEPIQGKSVPIDKALEQEQRLKDIYKEDGSVRNLLDTARTLEDLTRHAGMHAAGVVISEGPLWDHVPVFCPEPETYVTQYHKDDVESAGLVKFDFLGLKTLTVIDVATRLIDKRPDRDEPFRIEKIPMTDKATFALLQSGETTNVFQLESSGMQTLFKQLRPDCFEDIVAAVALYRPGPLGSGMVEDFVQRKHGRVPVEYPHPSLKNTLKDTYGVIVYQEQVMQIAREMAGYSLGGADLLRRAMGKKKAEEMAKQKAIFLEGAQEKGFSKEDADRVFELMAYFAGYGFNKCLAGDTEVVDADTGEHVTVAELYETPREIRVHAIDDRMQLSARPVTDVVSNGRKPVFELTTALGRRITATATHRFRTLDGWTPLGELAVGEHLALPRSLPVAADLSWPDHELITLAGLIAEGNTCHPSCLYFYGNDAALVDDFAQAASHFEASIAKITARSDQRLEVCVSTGRSQAREGSGYFVEGNTVRSWSPPKQPRSGAYAWASRLGILGKKAVDKRIPPQVFRLRDADLELFVGRLWSGDGFVANETLAVPFYSTSSRGLATDVQNALLRLGIVSRIHEKSFRYRGTLRPGFTVNVLGEDGVYRFVDRIGPHLVGRDDQLATLRRHIASTERGLSSKDVIPAEVRTWVAQERERAGLTWRELEERSGVSTKELVGKGSRTKRGFRRATIAKLAEFFGSARLRAVAESDVYWDRIVSIEARGEQETYDLTVDVDHNFVANGVVVHNSHSAAYALITYQTAYLKAHFPVEFVAATLSADKDKTDKVVRTVAEARAMGITVLPPDVNESEIDFTVVYDPKSAGKVRRGKDKPVCLGGRVRDAMGPRIRFGLGGVRGVGGSALEAIFEARSGDGEGPSTAEGGTKQPFVDMFDFTSRVDLRRVNKNVVDSLVMSGGFDSVHEPTGVTRAMASAGIDSAIERGKKIAAERSSGQTNLFGLMAGGDEEAEKALTHPGGSFPTVEPWDTLELLAKEKQTLGFYVSGHPLDRYATEIKRFCTASVETLAEMPDGTEVTVGGSVEAYRERTTKMGKRIAFFDLEDPGGRVEVIVRPRILDTEGLREVLGGGVPVVATGTVQHEGAQGGGDDEQKVAKLILDSAAPLAASLQAKTKSVRVRLMVDRVDRARLEALRATLQQHPGTCPVSLELASGTSWTVALPSTGLRVDPSDALMSSLERLFGEKVCELR